jgi:site-specific DNA-adenine methylase
MWSYYGAKTTIVDKYPRPVFDTIIEPFAGSARYALKYFDRRVILMEKNEVVFQIWKYLQQAKESDIRKLPHFLKPGDRLRNYHFDHIGERYLMGFLIAKGSEKTTRDLVSRWVAVDRPNFLNFSLLRIEKSLFKIRHWDIRKGDYRQLENLPATWFIDPPYQKTGGMHYPNGSRDIDYSFLGPWCIERKGQVVVCDNDKADWLPFRFLTSHKGRKGWYHECIWTNFPFGGQLRLFEEEYKQLK